MTSKHTWMLLLAILASGVTATAEAQSSQKKRKVIDFVFHELDTNGDKQLSEHEFVGKKSGEGKEQARKQFRSFDRDRDRSLTHKEYLELKRPR
jgi:Ca2+-binding EF-hand superfamily protein